MRSAYKFLGIVLTAIFIAAIGVGGYVVYGYLHAKNAPRQPLPIPEVATSTDTVLQWSFPEAHIATSSWKKYANDELGYEIAYPADLVMASHDRVATFAFKKESYFHWPLLDDAKVTVVATTTCEGIPDAPVVASSTFTLNGMQFRRTESVDVAAGSIFRQVMYETMGADACYQILLFDRGANGAGFYVSDASFIERYDKQHEADYTKVLEIFHAMVQGFALRFQPAGELER